MHVRNSALLLLLTLAPPLVAAPPEPGFTLVAAEAIQAAGLELRQGPLVVSFADGWLVPIKQGERALGYAFAGTGSLEASFGDEGDALAFANRRALGAQISPDQLRALAHRGAPYRTSITQGLILAQGDWSAELATRPQTEATEIPTLELQRRLKLLDELLDLGDVADEPASQEMVADFRGADRLGYDRVRALDDRWLALWRNDDSGAPLDDLVLFAEDNANKARAYTVALAPWPDPPVGQALRKDGVEALGVEAKILTAPISGGLQAQIDVDATFRLKAYRSVESIHVDVPRREAKGHSWQVASIDLDGQPLAVPEDIDDGATLRLPQALATGAEAKLRVVTRDTWSLQATGGHGQASKAMAPLPMVAHMTRWPHSIAVGVPAGGTLDTVLTGRTDREWTDGPVRWVQSSTDTTPAQVQLAVGSWVSAHEASIQGLPAVRVHLFKDEARTLPTFGPFARTVIQYYQQLMPPFPTQELEIYQTVDDWFQFTWIAHQGLVLLQQMVATDQARADQPHLEEATLAHEIAHQWWGAQVDNARVEDQWMNETFAQVYSCLFVAAAFGPADCDTRKKSWRKAIERELDAPHEVSLRRARAEARWRTIAYIYGPYVFGTMLRARLGDDAFFGGLDNYLRQRQGRDGTAELLQASFEATSGRPLGDFFDYWVEGGFIPSLHLEWSDSGAKLRSDVPFGTIDVPIRVARGGGSSETIWVNVVDGQGAVGFSSAPSAVELDPDGLVLARSRKVSRAR